MKNEYLGQTWYTQRIQKKPEPSDNFRWYMRKVNANTLEHRIVHSINTKCANVMRAARIENKIIKMTKSKRLSEPEIRKQ